MRSIAQGAACDDDDSLQVRDLPDCIKAILTVFSLLRRFRDFFDRDFRTGVRRDSLEKIRGQERDGTTLQISFDIIGHDFLITEL